MRTVKSSMKNFFATIFCFLMNLIPGKKLWAMVNAGLSTEMAVNMKNSMKSGQAAYEKKSNIIDRTGSIVFGNLQNDGKYIQDYISYLYEYVDYLSINKSSIKEFANRVSFIKYEDTG